MIAISQYTRLSTVNGNYIKINHQYIVFIYFIVYPLDVFHPSPFVDCIFVISFRVVRFIMKRSISPTEIIQSDVNRMALKSNHLDHDLDPHQSTGLSPGEEKDDWGSEADDWGDEISLDNNVNHDDANNDMQEISRQLDSLILQQQTKQIRRSLSPSIISSTIRHSTTGAAAFRQDFGKLTGSALSPTSSSSSSLPPSLPAFRPYYIAFIPSHQQRKSAEEEEEKERRHIERLLQKYEIQQNEELTDSSDVNNSFNSFDPAYHELIDEYEKNGVDNSFVRFCSLLHSNPQQIMRYGGQAINATRTMKKAIQNIQHPHPHTSTSDMRCKRCGHVKYVELHTQNIHQLISIVDCY